MLSIKKSVIALKNLIILSILFLSAIRFFRTFPFKEEFFKVQGFILLVLLCFCVYYVLRKLLLNEYITTYEIFLIFIAFFFPIYSAFRANLVFGQPILFGVLSERGWLTVIVGVLILYKISRKKWTIGNLENTFVVLSWLCLALYLSLYLFLDPHMFDRSFVSFPKLKGVHFKLHFYFIAFGLLYYYVKSTYQKKIRYVFFCLFFLAFIVFFDRGRGLIISLVLTLISITYSHSRFRLRNFLIIALVLLFALFICISFFPKSLNLISDSAYQVVEAFNDTSWNPANTLRTRILELHKIWDFVKHNPGIIFLGCGKLSLRWNEGFSGEFDYLFPSDLGMAGAWFIYGLAGLIMILLQLFFIYYGRTELNKVNDFYISIKFFVIFVLLNSVFTGMVILNPATLVIPSAIIYQIKKNSANMHHVE